MRRMLLVGLTDFVQNHRTTFSFPTRPFVSNRGQHLIACLLQDKETRLCSRRYQFKDMQYRSQQSSDSTGSRPNQMDFAGRFVFPYDAKDIKAHKWFRGVPWERLHELDPPFVPMIRYPDDTQYFNEDEPITDFSESDDDDDDDDNDQPLPESEEITLAVDLTNAAGRDGADDNVAAISLAGGLNALPASTVSYAQQCTPPEPQHVNLPEDNIQVTTMPNIVAAAVTAADMSATVLTKRALREARLAEALSRFDRSIQNAVRSWLAVPYDSLRLRNFELQVDVEPGLRASERDALKVLIRMHGRKERKRPRDRLLRDPGTKKAVLEERRKTAFLGYDWARMQALPVTAMLMTGPVNGIYACLGAAPSVAASVATGHGFGAGGGCWPYAGAPPGHDHVAAMRALHGGRLSMK